VDFASGANIALGNSKIPELDAAEAAAAAECLK
jgi:hypothetical protein